MPVGHNPTSGTIGPMNLHEYSKQRQHRCIMPSVNGRIARSRQLSRLFRCICGRRVRMRGLLSILLVASACTAPNASEMFNQIDLELVDGAMRHQRCLCLCHRRCYRQLSHRVTYRHRHHAYRQHYRCTRARCGCGSRPRLRRACRRGLCSAD